MRERRSSPAPSWGGLPLGPGELAKSNADQVRKIRGIMEGLDLEVATPSDVRQLLQLKGKENVGF